MKKISQQPKALTIGIALVLGFSMLGAGCAQNAGDNDAATPSTASTATAAPMPTQAPNDNGMQDDNSAMQTNDAGNDNDGHMQAGAGDSQSPVSDTWITTKVQAKLHTISGLDNGDISVETNNGNVLLTGRVDSQDQLDTAVTAIKTLKGVKNVDTSGVTVGADTDQ